MVRKPIGRRPSQPAAERGWRSRCRGFATQLRYCAYKRYRRRVTFEVLRRIDAQTRGLATRLRYCAQRRIAPVLLSLRFTARLVDTLRCSTPTNWAVASQWPCGSPPLARHQPETSEMLMTFTQCFEGVIGLNSGTVARHDLATVQPSSGHRRGKIDRSELL